MWIDSTRGEGGRVCPAGGRVRGRGGAERGSAALPRRSTSSRQRRAGVVGGEGGAAARAESTTSRPVPVAVVVEAMCRSKPPAIIRLRRSCGFPQLAVAASGQCRSLLSFLSRSASPSSARQGGRSRRAYDVDCQGQGVVGSGRRRLSCAGGKAGPPRP